ncbi:MAG TPA: tetratricopeptide repeat protein [Pseudomonadales bacterium]|nr:tetratricopeptide repeat protein [Pseudomonadales bacterium]
MNKVRQAQLLKYLICVLLAVITFTAYAFVANCVYVAFDDRNYIIGNFDIQNGFSWHAVKWAFTSFYSNNWHPLTWFSHILDCRLYGLDPAGPHLTNLAIHVTNTVLVFLLFQNITTKLWQSAFVATLFAIHPMHVESVAWVSERKDVLSTFFLLLTLLAYARYVELAAAKKPACWLVYALSLFLFILGLMSKPMLVTLPGILFLLDFWPLRRVQLPLKNQPKVLRDVFVEKIPFIILAGISCVVTYIAQNTTGAVKSVQDFPLSQRLAHIPVSYEWYLFKIFWPANLSVFYPFRTGDYVPAEDIVFAVLLLAALTAFAVWRARKYPWFIVGWLWFLGTLIPVIGLVQAGNQAYADRYAYIPYIGLSIILAWGLSELLSRWPGQQIILWVITVFVAVACFWRTTVEVRYWKDGFTLLNRTIALDPKDELAWAVLGLEYEVRGNNNKAIDYETQATTLDDQFGWAWLDLGRMLIIKGDYPAAENAFQMALQSDHFVPDRIDSYNNLGDVYVNTGQFAQAIPNYQSSLDLSPNQPLALNGLGLSYVQTQQPDLAITAYQNAIKLNPDFPEAHLSVAMLLAKAGRDSEAISHYRKVVELNTNTVIALNNLAWLLAADSDPKLRNGPEAVSLSQHACELTQYQEAFLIGTLAVAYAEAGRFNEAVTASQKAQDVALAHGQKVVAEQNLKLMQLFKSGKPFHLDTVAPPSQKPSP